MSQQQVIQSTLNRLGVEPEAVNPSQRRVDHGTANIVSGTITGWETKGSKECGIGITYLFALVLWSTRTLVEIEPENITRSGDPNNIVYR